MGEMLPYFVYTIYAVAGKKTLFVSFGSTHGQSKARIISAVM